MLDIKFKAKRRNRDKQPEWLFSESIQKMPVLGGFLIMLWIVGEGWVEVESETVCMFTGRTDINDNELYCGDRIDEHNHITFDLCSGFSINGDRPLHYYKKENMLFNGNIHD